MSLFASPVLVGVDSTGPARAALLAAVELCRLSGAELHLVHVRTASPLVHGQPMTPRQRERADEEATALLEREAAVARELGVDPAGTHLRYANRIDRGIAKVQEEFGAQLLVIGSSTDGRMARWLTSTAAVRHAPASVLVVRPPGLVVLDDDEHAAVEASTSGEREP